ncbi:MAG TPA: hypothetical protein VGR22_04965, partial [Thermomicrobiales bacterium]|nr:hypothetical protein [Thermomicrobiales bacterium]
MRGRTALHHANHRQTAGVAGQPIRLRNLMRSGIASRISWLIAIVIAALAVGWLALVILFDSVRFVVLNPNAKTGFEVFLAIGQIFGAFVLAISPLEPARIRLRWVAAGFLVFGVGGLAYGYLYPLLVDSPHLTATMYGSLYVRTVGTALCAAGLALGTLPRIERSILILLTAAAILCGALLIPLADHLPPLIRISGTTEIIDHDPVIDATDPTDHVHLSDLEALLSDTPRTVPGLTAWH